MTYLVNANKIIINYMLMLLKLHYYPTCMCNRWVIGCDIVVIVVVIVNTIWDIGTWATYKHSKSSKLGENWLLCDSKWEIYSTSITNSAFSRIFYPCRAYSMHNTCRPCASAHVHNYITGLVQYYHQKVGSWHTGQHNGYCIVISVAKVNRAQRLIKQIRYTHTCY